MGIPSTFRAGKMVHLVPEWDADFNHEYIDAALSICKDLGFETIRVDCRWNDVEKTKGEFKFRKQNGQKDYAYFAIKAKELGIRIIFTAYQCPQWANGGDSDNNGPPLDMDDYANFCYELAMYFKPGGTLAQEEGWDSDDRVVVGVEFWNEPNGHLWEVWDSQSSQFVFQNQPDRFAEMCNKGAAAIKRADEGMLAISGAVCTGCADNPWKPYMEAMFNAGFVPPDVLAITGYYGGGKNNDSPQKQMNPRFEIIREQLDQRGFEDVPIWIMECGAGSIAIGNVKREQYQADIVEGLYETDLPYWKEHYKGDFVWTLLVDQNNNYNTGFTWGGLAAWPFVYPMPEEQKKRAYDVMKRMTV